MATLTIGSETFTVYANVATADSYLTANIDFAIWNANSDDDKGRFLVSATRLFDQQVWLDDYDTVAKRAVVTDIINASIELSNYLSNGNTGILGLEEQEAEAKRLKAGSAEIENYRNLSGTSAGKYETVWPAAVFALLRDYLGGSASSTLGALSYATSTCSSIIDSGLIQT